MVDKAKVEGVVFVAIQDYNQQAPGERQLGSSRETVLFGREGNLDSLGLVNLIVAVEQGVAEALGKKLTIVSEDAMSRQFSPFRTVGTLADYVWKLIQEQ